MTFYLKAVDIISSQLFLVLTSTGESSNPWERGALQAGAPHQPKHCGCSIIPRCWYVMIRYRPWPYLIWSYLILSSFSWSYVWMSQSFYIDRIYHILLNLLILISHNCPSIPPSNRSSPYHPFPFIGADVSITFRNWILHVNNKFSSLVPPGNLIPYEYAIALLENAVDNGVELRIRRSVTSIDTDTVREWIHTWMIYMYMCMYMYLNIYV